MPGNGYCKICHSPYAPAVNKLLVDGKNSTAIMTAVEPLGLTFTRKTLGAHKQHITHPLITAAEAAQRRPKIMPKSNQAVLEAIRDIGAARAITNPEEVTVDHAIKAATALQAKESRGDNILVIMAKAVMQDVPEDVQGYLSGETIDVTPIEQGEDIDSSITASTA